MRKEVPVAGFSEKSRLEELEKIKAKYEKKEGYLFIEYMDKGAINSIAVFEVDEAILKKESGKTKNIIIGLVAIFVLWMIFSPSETPEEKMQEQLKITLQEAKKMTLDNLKAYSTEYAKSKGVNPNYYDKFFSCIGDHLYSKSETLLLEEISGWCERDTKREDYNSPTFNYINKASFIPYFSQWDGSYTPFIEYIKSYMNNPDSFEHVKTLYSFVKSGENPYMQIKCTYRGTNGFGAIVTETMTAKVDDKTKKIYDVEKEEY